MRSKSFKTLSFGNSLVVQWLGFSVFTAAAQVQSLVGELRFCKPHGQKKKKSKTTVNFYSKLESQKHIQKRGRKAKIIFKLQKIVVNKFLCFCHICNTLALL